MEQNGLLVLDVKGSELRDLCDHRLRAMAASYDRSVVSLKREMERIESVRKLDPRGYHDVTGGGQDVLLERMKRSTEHNAREVTFMRDHIEPSRTYSVYWRDLRDLLFVSDEDGIPGCGGNYGYLGQRVAGL